MIILWNLVTFRLDWCENNNFRGESELGNVGFWGKGRGGPEYPEKNLSEKGENQQQDQPTYGVDAGIWTRASLVEGECCHHCGRWKKFM